MKRLPGVIVSCVVLILLCLIQLLTATVMVASAVWEQSRTHGGGLPGTPGVPTGWMTLMIFGESAFIVALAAWGLVTAGGLFKMRRWARTSMLVIGGGLTFMGLCALMTTVVTVAVSKALAAGMDTAKAQTMHTVMVVMAAVLGIVDLTLLGVGIFWLVYFSRHKVREAFAAGAGADEASKRPVLIAVLAVLFLLGAPMCLIVVFLPMPVMFFGFTLDGWGKIAVYLIYAALVGASGVGLWRMEEWGLKLALLGQALGIAQSLVYMVRPSLMTNYTAEMNERLHVQAAQTTAATAAIQGTMMRVTFGMSVLVMAGVIAALHHYRGAFARAGATEEATPLELP